MQEEYNGRQALESQVQELEAALQQAQASSAQLSPELQAQFDESQEQLQRYAAAAEHSAAESENLRGEIEGLQKELEEAQVRCLALDLNAWLETTAIFESALINGLQHHASVYGSSKPVCLARTHAINVRVLKVARPRAASRLLSACALAAPSPSAILQVQPMSALFPRGRPFWLQIAIP